MPSSVAAGRVVEQRNVRVCVVVGTRPEIIKMAPVMRALRDRDIPMVIVHSGQHYTYGMDGVFWAQLGLPEPDFTLGVGSGSHAVQTARILERVEDALVKSAPDVVLVEGDTNTVLGAALAAVKLHVRVGHVEAGLRSGDRRMPEELNRILVDHVSDYLFAPTAQAAENLAREGIAGPKIAVTGNTIVDAVVQNRELACTHGAPLESYGVEDGRYFLATLHRQENVDDSARLHALFEGLRGVAKRHGMPVLLPLHPRTRARLGESEVPTDGIRLLEPLDYFSFLRLEASAALILTDSGGVQEEACILRVPCVTLRDNTERPETVSVGANVLVGADADEIRLCTDRMLAADRNWSNAFGDGHAAERILDCIIGG